MSGKDWGRERLWCVWDLKKPRVVEREVNGWEMRLDGGRYPEMQGQAGGQALTNPDSPEPTSLDRPVAPMVS